MLGFDTNQIKDLGTDLLELCGLDDVQDFLQLVEEHDLLGRVDLRPEPEQGHDDLLRQTRIFLEELDDAVGQLRVVDGQRLDLVQRHQNLKTYLRLSDFFLRKHEDADVDVGEPAVDIDDVKKPIKVIFAPF